MTVLYFGDIFGRPGRYAIRMALPNLKEKYRPDFIIGNAENLSGGRGVNKKSYREMMELGFHCLTSGNHIWDNKDVYTLFEAESYLLRPANYPAPCPGSGAELISANGKSLVVINLMGRLFMDPIDCPFQAADEIMKKYNRNDTPILVDMHADATSEKCSMGWHLGGRVSAVVGSHTHVQTADERILPGGTAFITDVGMCGSFDSSIGFRPEITIKKFMSKRPHHGELAKDNPGVSAVVIQINEDGTAKSIERIRFSVEGIQDNGDLE